MLETCVLLAAVMVHEHWWLQPKAIGLVFFNKFILHFRDFQHTFINNTNFNNFLTNNSINNCFSASFNPSSLKVEHDVMLEPKKNGHHQGSTSRPRAWHSVPMFISRVWRPLGHPGAPTIGLGLKIRLATKEKAPQKEKVLKFQNYFQRTEHFWRCLNFYFF